MPSLQVISIAAVFGDSIRRIVNGAGEIAQSTTGVPRVENQIKVQPKKLADDAALAKEVKKAFAARSVCLAFRHERLRQQR